MKKKEFLVFAAVALFLAPAAFGDIVSGTGGFQSWAVGDLNQDGTPYWDHTSWDTGLKNIGYCISGTGACGMSGAPGYIPYYGTAGGAAVSAFTFVKNSSGSQAAMQIEIAGNANFNIFGWYDVATNTKTQLFSGPQGAGAVSIFTPTANYGFYLQTGSGTFYTNSGVGADSGKQHFALFQQSAVVGSEVYWMGIEDLPLSSSDKDYNDMVIKLNSVGVPEPSSILGLGLGIGTVLLLLGTSLRRKRAE
jgi:hypothetical protein